MSGLPKGSKMLGREVLTSGQYRGYIAERWLKPDGKTALRIVGQASGATMKRPACGACGGKGR